MWEPPTNHPIHRMFSGLAEHTFHSRLGIADPSLVDYVSKLLSRFIHTDEIHRLRGAAGTALTELNCMVAEAESMPESGRTRREYYRHIGDISLFWSGLFPEALSRNVHTWGSHAVVRYTLCGKKSYHIASQFDDDAYQPEASILRRLSEQFEVCATGLREIRRDWEELASRNLPANGLIHQ
jgi:hypothetical protein